MVVAREKRTKRFMAVWAVLSGLGLAILPQAHAENFLTGSVTGYQYFSTNDGAVPISLAIMGGEYLDTFGTIGVFGQLLRSSKNQRSYRTAGIQVAPDFFRNSWGAFQWVNKVGFGNYEGSTHVTVGTGFLLETGSFFHVTTEFLHGIDTSGDIPSENRFGPNFGLGIGFHFR